MNSFHVNRSSSIRGVLTTYEYQPDVSNQHVEEEVAADEAEVLKDVETVLAQVRQLVRDDILFELTRLRSIKWHIACRVRFVKLVVDGDTGAETEVTSEAVFHGRCHTFLTLDDDIDELIDVSIDKIADSLSKYTRNGSGWSVDAVTKVELVVAPYRPLAASTYIRTPSRLAATKAVVNVENKTDEKCFLWSVLAQLYPQKDHKYRVSK